jgi:hypothetical protein
MRKTMRSDLALKLPHARLVCPRQLDLAARRLKELNIRHVDAAMNDDRPLPLALQYACGPQGGRDDPTGIERTVGRFPQQARCLQGSRDNRSRICPTG